MSVLYWGAIGPWGQRRSPTWPISAVTGERLWYQGVADLSVRGSELFSLPEVVMVHLLMEVLGLGKEEGGDVT